MVEDVKLRVAGLLGTYNGDEDFFTYETSSAHSKSIIVVVTLSESRYMCYVGDLLGWHSVYNDVSRLMKISAFI